MEVNKRILITGGAGFIGCHVVKRLVKNYPNYLIVNFDSLTYAGNLENLKDVENAPNYVFVKGDIVNGSDIIKAFEKYELIKVSFLKSSVENYNFEEMILDYSLLEDDKQLLENLLYLQNRKEAYKNMQNICDKRIAYLSS